ncbi:MAG TPA: hypothetical protein ENI39_07335 [Anaerolineae bacterium]|nr:hypothetical protein [Anaerolineae bacterium]
MKQPVKDAFCPLCKRKMAYIVAHLRLDYCAKVWKAEWRYSTVCPFCGEFTCMIEGCEQAPTAVYRHTFFANKAAPAVRNDFWVCRHHAPMIARYRELRSQEKAGCLVLAGYALVVFFSAPRITSTGLIVLTVSLGMMLLLLTVWLWGRADTYARNNGLVKEKRFTVVMADGRSMDMKFD